MLLFYKWRSNDVRNRIKPHSLPKLYKNATANNLNENHLNETKAEISQERLFLSSEKIKTSSMISVKPLGVALTFVWLINYTSFWYNILENIGFIMRFVSAFAATNSYLLLQTNERDYSFILFRAEVLGIRFWKSIEIVLWIWLKCNKSSFSSFLACSNNRNYLSIACIFVGEGCSTKIWPWTR